jgi:hypothetical protein
MTLATSTHAYGVRLRKDHRGVDLISDALRFGSLWYLETSHAIDYAKSYSRKSKGNHADKNSHHNHPCC